MLPPSPNESRVSCAEKRERDGTRAFRNSLESAARHAPQNAAKPRRTLSSLGILSNDISVGINYTLHMPGNYVGWAGDDKCNSLERDRCAPLGSVRDL